MTSDGRQSAPGGGETTTGAARSTQRRRAQSKALVLPETLSVQELAELLDRNPIDVIKQLMRNGIMASMNQIIDYKVASIATTAFGVRTTMATAKEVSNGAEKTKVSEEDQENLIVRPPAVAILGHVDHGKTSLLDTIRKTKVAEREVGGITQHIGAYQVTYKGQQITFLDTPGHEAFTAIRARGARATDIAVLVVAADDGIMPQTAEAINHAKAANVPIIVAINKMDLPGADPERVKRQLSERELLVEDWGGDVISVDVSAKTGEGIDNLLDSIALVAEVSELRANPDKAASGVILEAKLDRRRGPTATVLIQDGTLNVTDYVVAGNAWGRVRAMTDAEGQAVKSVAPGSAVEVLGLGSLPEAGDQFNAVATEKNARGAASAAGRSQSSQQGQARALTLDEVVNQIEAGEVRELNLVLKADVQGSVEAVRQSLEGIAAQDARVRVLHAGSGGVTESDVLLASASDAIIIAFTVGAEPSAERLAARMGVEIRNYNIIYQLIDDIDQAVRGMLEPTVTDVILGKAEVREVFPSKRGVQIAGCRIMEGRISRNATVRVMRGAQVVHETTINSLRHFREEVNEMNAGTECGIMLQGFNEFEEGDIIESHREERARR